MQYSLNKGHQHLKRLQQKSWISYPDCLRAQDKQLTQYLLIPRSNGGCSQNILNSKIEMSSTTYKWPKSWSSKEDPVVPLERNLYGHPLAGLLWERQFEKVLLKHGRGEIPNWECLCVHREKGSFFSVNVDDIELAGNLIEFDFVFFLTTWPSRSECRGFLSTSCRCPSLSFSHQRCQQPRRHTTGKVMRNGSQDMRQFLPKARNMVCLLFFRGQSIMGISFLLFAPAALFWKFQWSKSVGSSGRVLLGISYLGNLSGHQKSDELYLACDVLGVGLPTRTAPGSTRLFASEAALQEIFGLPLRKQWWRLLQLLPADLYIGYDWVRGPAIASIARLLLNFAGWRMEIDYLGEAMPAGKFSSAFADVVFRQAHIGHKT